MLEASLPSLTPILLRRAGLMNKRERDRLYYAKNRGEINRKRREARNDATRAKRRSYYQANKEDINRKVRAYRKANPRSAEFRARKAAYARKRNATPEVREGATRRAASWRESKLVTLAGRPRPTLCDICGNENNNKHKRIAFDHCHKTGIFRGWICDTCNYVIGLIKDDANYARKIAAYLERTKNGTSPQLTLPGV